MTDPQFNATLSERRDEIGRDQMKYAIKRLAPVVAVISAAAVIARVVHEIKTNEDED